MANIEYYKVLNGDESTQQNYKWNLPCGNKPGKWMMPIEGRLVECDNGYHVCRGAQQLIHWLGPEIYGAEIRGEILLGNTKTVVREVRLIAKVETWNETTARLFAADCAEHVLHLYESECPGDDRPRNAIAAARAFARGEIDSAANTAAWSAANTAARSASGFAASSAAWSAASSASWVAARVAARVAEPIWQTQRLREYLTGERT